MHLLAKSTAARACALGFALVLGTGGSALAQIKLGPEKLVQANGADIAVNQYSVPSFNDWNGDGLPDLVVGEGGNNVAGKVLIYLNNGTPTEPAFGGSSYVKAGGTDISLSGSGCMGAFPRMWDTGSRKDLLVGGSDGKVRLYQNSGASGVPSFNAGTLVRYGPAGQKQDINVTGRATCSQVDWNNDGRQDLLVGGYYGNVYVYLNQGTNLDPDFTSQLTVQSAGSPLKVSARSSPEFADLDGDGFKDLLVGDADGKLWFYKNTGSLTSPDFSAASSVLGADGRAIQLALRSRPFVCDWDGDHHLDLLVGAGDHKVHLYTITPEPGTLCLLGGCAVLLLRRRRA